MDSNGPLRVIDFGVASPLRSQTVWHAVAYGVSAGAPPTLSIVRPSAPYVCLGYHRRLDEIDLEGCRRAGLPVFRRMIGGGPVYLDERQLFFQISVPIGAVPASRPKAMRALLEPAVAAFRDVGIPAELDGDGEISVAGAKVSGVGGGQIEDAAVAVGNLIEDFDHAAMARVLAVDDERAREAALDLMRRFLRPTRADPSRFVHALVRRYAKAFGLVPERGVLGPAEVTKLRELDALFGRPSWVRGPERPLPPARQVKVRSGVWVFAAEAEGTRVVGSVVADRLERVHVTDPEANGLAGDIEKALVGRGLAEAVALAAAGFGEPGRRVAAAVGRADGRSV